MRELLAIIRPDKINQTKRALAEAGFPAFTCLRCLGRGKKAVAADVLDVVLGSDELPRDYVGENLTEGARLIAKRLLIVVVTANQVEAAARAIISVNQTGNPGDGRIFVLPITESHRVSTGETEPPEPVGGDARFTPPKPPEPVGGDAQ